MRAFAAAANARWHGCAALCVPVQRWVRSGSPGRAKGHVRVPPVPCTSKARTSHTQLERRALTSTLGLPFPPGSGKGSRGSGSASLRRRRRAAGRHPAPTASGAGCGRRRVGGAHALHAGLGQTLAASPRTRHHPLRRQAASPGHLRHRQPGRAGCRRARHVHCPQPDRSPRPLALGCPPDA